MLILPSLLVYIKNVFCKVTIPTGNISTVLLCIIKAMHAQRCSSSTLSINGTVSHPSHAREENNLPQLITRVPVANVGRSSPCTQGLARQASEASFGDTEHSAAGIMLAGMQPRSDRRQQHTSRHSHTGVLQMTLDEGQQVRTSKDGSTRQVCPDVAECKHYTGASVLYDDMRTAK